MSDEPTFKIPRDVIEPIIQAHVSSAVAAAMGDKSAILQEAVAQILNQKVGDDGRPSDYRAIPWIQYVMKDALKKATRAAIEEEIGKNENVIRAAIVKELKKGETSALVRQLITAMTGAFTKEDNLRFRLSVEVSD